MNGQENSQGQGRWKAIGRAKEIRIGDKIIGTDATVYITDDQITSRYRGTTYVVHDTRPFDTIPVEEFISQRHGGLAQEGGEGRRPDLLDSVSAKALELFRRRPA